ncbi:hypothetical protein [Halobacillus amylolyticus]|uniref:Uncharacterized protein n=1 Tax=Halobacillus amylolyticus TaxID=2932259 RepID=A0ABY4HBT9_9BACI|nr:hypothetical protein [Halobacillus amylolyticus]UOR12179.1 hypothetical protein MUO15_01175 [Halobacillus amylolyticus]
MENSLISKGIIVGENENEFVPNTEGCKAVIVDQEEMDYNEQYYLAYLPELDEEIWLADNEFTLI